MMELTKDNVVITSDGDIFIPVIGFRDIKSRLPQGKELKQQITDDYEKARKFDEIKDGTLGFIRAFNWLDKNKSIFLPIPNTPEPETPQPRKNQNQKLRELIEKRIEENESYKNDPDSGGLYYELQNLLEESKK